MKQDIPKGTENDLSLHNVKEGKGSREELQEGVKSFMLQHASAPPILQMRKLRLTEYMGLACII